MADRFLLDTCALIFLTTGATIDGTCKSRIEQVLDGGGSLLISPISAWELGLLVERGRIALSQSPERWFNEVTAKKHIALAPMTPAILIASSFLPSGISRDPADRILAATAREIGYPLVTRDKILLRYAAAGHISALAC